MNKKDLIKYIKKHYSVFLNEIDVWNKEKLFQLKKTDSKRISKYMINQVDMMKAAEENLLGAYEQKEFVPKLGQKLNPNGITIFKELSIKCRYRFITANNHIQPLINPNIKMDFEPVIESLADSLINSGLDEAIKLDFIPHHYLDKDFVTKQLKVIKKKP